MGLRRAQSFQVLALQNQREWRLRTVLPKVQSLRTIISSFVCMCIHMHRGVCVCVCVYICIFILLFILCMYVLNHSVVSNSLQSHRL